MEINDRAEKHVVRFNTEANEDWVQVAKLKKGGAGKSKLLIQSKSALRLHKN